MKKVFLLLFSRGRGGAQCRAVTMGGSTIRVAFNVF